MASINKKNLHLPDDAVHVIGYIVTIVLSKWSSRQEESPMKTDEKALTMECPFLKRGSVAAYQRSLRIRALEGKNIPRPSREVMNFIKNTIIFTLRVSPNFDFTDPQLIGITQVI